MHGVCGRRAASEEAHPASSVGGAGRPALRRAVRAVTHDRGRACLRRAKQPHRRAGPKTRSSKKTPGSACHDTFEAPASAAAMAERQARTFLRLPSLHHRLDVVLDDVDGEIACNKAAVQPGHVVRNKRRRGLVLHVRRLMGTGKQRCRRTERRPATEEEAPAGKQRSCAARAPCRPPAWPPCARTPE